MMFKQLPIIVQISVFIYCNISDTAFTRTFQGLSFIALTFLQWLTTGRAADQIKGTIITSPLNSSEQARN